MLSPWNYWLGSFFLSTLYRTPTHSIVSYGRAQNLLSPSMGLKIVLWWLLLTRWPEGYCKPLSFLSLSLHPKCDGIQFYALFHWHRAVGVNRSSIWKRWWGGGECCDGSAVKQGWQGWDQGRRPYLHMESSLHLLASR